MKHGGKRQLKPRNETMTDPTHYEIHEGINGNGNWFWRVVAVSNATGSWKHLHDFTTLAEAESWQKWA
jgi:hypothetical protein